MTHNRIGTILLLREKIGDQEYVVAVLLEYFVAAQGKDIAEACSKLGRLLRVRAMLGDPDAALVGSAPQDLWDALPKKKTSFVTVDLTPKEWKARRARQRRGKV